MTTKADETRSNAAKARAEASFKKEERDRDGAKAMMEYQANSVVVREQMAKLKALRLAKEAADKNSAPPPRAAKKSKSAKASAKT